MQNKNYKKVLTFALILSMIMPIGSAAADEDWNNTDDWSTAGEVAWPDDDTELDPIDADLNSVLNAAENSSQETSEEQEENERIFDEAEKDSSSEKDKTDSEESSDTDSESDKDEEKDEEQADGEETESEADEEEGDDEEGGSRKRKKADPITEAEALAMCEKKADNDKYELYLDEKNHRFCLKVKASGKCWWSSPINAEADPTIIDEKGSTMKSGQIDQAQSMFAINIGDLNQGKRTELPAPVYSAKARAKYKDEANGFNCTYTYSAQGVTLTVHYELTDRGVKMYVKTDEIVEKDNSSAEGKVLTKMLFAPYMGAASSVDDSGAPIESGYIIIPDGSGAVINYNNGKSNYASYSQKVYGRDYTAVPLKAPRVTKQAYMPVMATVQGKSGLVMVATSGDANVFCNAQVSGQNKQAYNNCWFMFETRSTDEFFMSGTDHNKITVFEKYGIKTPEFAVEFMPVESDDEVSPADCAEVYRNYLISDKGLKKTTEKNSSKLYIDTYGAVLKEESIIGIPVTVKKKLTTFNQARTIMSELQNSGADSIVLNYNDWTKNDVKELVSTKAKALGKLGKTSALTDLNSDKVSVYGTINNFTMKNGIAGYGQLSNTAIRVSSAYSRQSEYSPAFGVAVTGVSPALIAPNTYVKIFSESLKSFKSGSITQMGYGDLSTKLVSDFSKKNSSSRNDTMNTVVEGYSNAQKDGQKIIAAGANSYILPYVQAVTDVPVYSSAFNITDADIPFYQMVVHGYVPVSTEAMNSSTTIDKTFLRALAAGSDVNYDMIYEDADELLDTRDDIYYYSHYAGWTQLAGAQAAVVKEILAPVSDYVISDYEVEGDVIRTTYSKEGVADEVIEVDTANFTVKAKGKTYDLVAKGAVEKGGAKG